MALVGDIQLQNSAVKPPALDTSKKFSAEGLTATTAFAVTDAGAGNTVSTTGLITAKSANDINAWYQTTNTDGDVSVYLSNDARPDWALKVSGTASDAFMIANSKGANDTCQYPAFSIGTAGAVGIGKTGAGNILDITYRNAATGGVVITEATNSIASKFISEASSGSIGTTTNSKFGFRTNSATVGVFDTSGNFGIGTDAPGAVLDVRGAAIFNEAGAAVDFRIEGDTEANLFFVDGSTDRIGIGTATPAVELDVDLGGDGTDVLMCVNGCICAAGYLGEKQGHTIECAGSALTQRTGLNFVVTDVGSVVDDSTNDATVVCISGANTCIPFLLCDGSTSDPIPLTGGSIGNQLANDAAPCLGGTLNGCDENVCCVCCLAIKGCYFGDGSQLTGVSSVPGCFSGDCTIIGCDAGGNVAAGATNIVLYGANAGYNVTTADNVVLIGSTVALCMTTATDQVIIGAKAGRCVLTCAGNVAIGAHAFYNECAGTYNTAVGDCAGHTQKGATTNTFIGAQSGVAVTTGSGNVFVGYKAGCANTTGSCCLIIGNGTCDLITGDFNGGSVVVEDNLGIGTTAPSSPLHVFDGTTTLAYGDYSSKGALIIGADLGTEGTQTDNTRKFGVISAPHYCTAEQPVQLVYMDANSSSSTINMGTGLGGLNAATKINFGTASDNVTVGGTTAMTIDENQRVGIGTAATSGYRLGIYCQTATNGTFSGILLRNPAGVNPNYGEQIHIEMELGIGGTGQGGVKLAAGKFSTYYTEATRQGNFRVCTFCCTGYKRGLTVNYQGYVSVGPDALLAPVQPLDVQGNACIAGTLYKNAGSFVIPHPLEDKKDTHHLLHSFIEGPRADLIYRGVIELTDGSAQVNVDTASGMTEGTFVALNRCAQAFINNETNWDAIRGSVTGNVLTIESNDSASTASVSWMVVGERCDPTIMEVDITNSDGTLILEPLKGSLDNPEREQ